MTMPTQVPKKDSGMGTGSSSAAGDDQKGKTDKGGGEIVKKRTKTKATPLPSKVRYPKWWKNLRYAGINIAAITTATIIPAQTGQRHFITGIFIITGGETNITLYDGSFPFTGPMDFGGTDEPRGISMPLGDAPIMLNDGSPFRIQSTTTAQISGYVNYFSEAVEVPPDQTK